MASDVKKLLKKNNDLVHSEMQKVVSHTQRNDDGWVLHTIMIEGCDAPFRFRRKQEYKKLVGARVNLTYYATTESVAGIDFEVMKVVRIKKA